MGWNHQLEINGPHKNSGFVLESFGMLVSHPFLEPTKQDDEFYVLVGLLEPNLHLPLALVADRSKQSHEKSPKKIWEKYYTKAPKKLLGTWYHEVSHTKNGGSRNIVEFLCGFMKGWCKPFPFIRPAFPLKLRLGTFWGGVRYLKGSSQVVKRPMVMVSPQDLGLFSSPASPWLIGGPSSK